MTSMAKTYQELKATVLKNRAAKKAQTNEDATPPAPASEQVVTLTGTPQEIVDDLFKFLDSDG
jgi:hypothetical protein